MAWGVFNKIKQGFKRVGSAVKKAAGFINDKVLKPFQPAVSGVLNAVAPTAGKVFDTVAGGVSHIASGGGVGSVFRPYKALG